MTATIEDRIAELAQDVRAAESELFAWRRREEFATDEGQRQAARANIAMYAQQVSRLRGQLAELRRARSTPAPRGERG